MSEAVTERTPPGIELREREFSSTPVDVLSYEGRIHVVLEARRDDENLPKELAQHALESDNAELFGRCVKELDPMKAWELRGQAMIDYNYILTHDEALELGHARAEAGADGDLERAARLEVVWLKFLLISDSDTKNRMASIKQLHKLLFEHEKTEDGTLRRVATVDAARSLLSHGLAGEALSADPDLAHHFSDEEQRIYTMLAVGSTPQKHHLTPATRDLFRKYFPAQYLAYTRDFTSSAEDIEVLLRAGEIAHARQQYEQHIRYGSPFSEGTLRVALLMDAYDQPTIEPNEALNNLREQVAEGVSEGQRYRITALVKESLIALKQQPHSIGKAHQMLQIAELARESGAATAYEEALAHLGRLWNFAVRANLDPHNGRLYHREELLELFEEFEFVGLTPQIEPTFVRHLNPLWLGAL